MLGAEPCNAAGRVLQFFIIYMIAEPFDFSVVKTQLCLMDLTCIEWREWTQREMIQSVKAHFDVTGVPELTMKDEDHAAQVCTGLHPQRIGINVCPRYIAQLRPDIRRENTRRKS